MKKQENICEIDAQEKSAHDRTNPSTKALKQEARTQC